MEWITLASGLVGWIVAIVESERLYRERRDRKADEAIYRETIRELRQEQWTAQIRSAREQEPTAPILMPRDGWIQHDHGRSH